MEILLWTDCLPPIGQ